MDFYALAVIALGAYRLFRLVAWDFVLQGPRDRLLGKETRVSASTTNSITDVIESFRRPRLEKFLRCPWCCGFWCCVILWGAHLAWPRPTLIVATVLASSTLVGLIDKAD